MVIGPIGFAAPALLWGLLALPVLYLLLRAVPPAPVRRRFPGVALLLGLKDDESQSDKTPWWLLVLRMLAVAAAIIGFAGPVLNPDGEVARSDAPLLILFDGGWADARDWDARRARAQEALAEAGREGRTASVVMLTDLPVEGVLFQAANGWNERVSGMTPNAWEPDFVEAAAWAENLTGHFDTLWFSDGLAYEGRPDLLTVLQTYGAIRVIEGGRPTYALRPVVYDDDALRVVAVRPTEGIGAEVEIAVHGLNPAGQDSILAVGTADFAPGDTEAEVAFTLQPELRNRITRFQISGHRTAGATSLADDGLRRREVALLAAGNERETLQLLSPLHYLNNALEPSVDLLDGELEAILPANPDVIVLADIAQLTQSQTRDIAAWVAQGGLLVRFAGPRLAASDISRDVEDPLMPVRLRQGGRSVGGTLTWGEPKALLPFPENSPFYGLTIPQDVVVNAQVVAQPDPALAERVIAALADGTPLVTRKSLGAGQVVLFHVTANADWSTLPLSGLFVEMLERLSISSHTALPAPEDLEGTTWVGEKALDAFGSLHDVDTVITTAGESLLIQRLSQALPPGLYAGPDRQIALNVMREDTVLRPATWPIGTVIEGLTLTPETRLKGPMLTGSLGLFLLDVLAALWLTGRLWGRSIPKSAMIVLLASALPMDVKAQDDAFAIGVTTDVVLAHVLTGDSEVDRTAQAGLAGLTRVLNQRTSIEPSSPVGVDLERDELSFFPFLYWPITQNQPLPSDEAYAKLNRYLRGGGMILFDTRDADIPGREGANAVALRRLAGSLNIPPLERIPEDHVLTRAFYLLQDFPGRYAGRDVWVEAAPPGAEQIEGMPFRNLNDGVTPVVIGGNDWASAWAIDRTGNRMFPVGRGFTGERQREIAYRFGVNLMMHVLTGNYKSDQVHVPALLDRLGQ
ncbi:DUF4159 domain-containing protein [Cochlodiniinecator piscidefendens]|uniref:DUF4159 domain-containing protein n=1 Tax=Cochlodiniinecator piscidefendens TaxID=2715756 RepID=UPI001409D11B|nr:DUF4159 domain-containing protein [Cochlodiniinecator piscidefendens]